MWNGFTVTVALCALMFAAHAQEWDPQYDLNQDNVIDQGDIFIIQQHWHTTAPTPTPLPPVARINEIRIDQPGSDDDEYFELSGTPGGSLDGLTYIVIGDGTGGSGTVEVVVALDGSTIPPPGFFVVAKPTFTLGAADLVTDFFFENSDNLTHVLVKGFSGSLGDDLDTNDDGVLDVTPWTDILDLIAVIEEENPPSGTEFHYGPPTVGPDGVYAPWQVYRCPDSTGPWLIGLPDPYGGYDTPGSANNCPQ
jgi:hypothetical protein